MNGANMKRPNYLFQIKERISADKIDAVFVPSDFFDIADSARVGICLRRLTDSGVIMRVMRGVYAKPYKYCPNADTVAHAIARNYGWTIAPCGDTALYESGIIKKSPEEWTYVSDGTYQSYSGGGIKLVFKHTDVKNELTGVTDRAALFIQTLRAIGKDNITDNTIRDIAKMVRYSDRPKISNGTQRVTAWVKRRLDEIYDKSYTSKYSAAFISQSESSAGSFINLRETGENVKNDKDTKTVSTFFGFAAKSKSEALIADSLHMAGLEYTYEKPLYRKEGRPYRPDFTIEYKSKMYYWEHLGLLDKKGYAANWMEKKKWYDANIPGQLLTTNEEGDVGKQIDTLIKDTFNIDIGKLIKDTPRRVTNCV